jgi:hypothetical protein
MSTVERRTGREPGRVATRFPRLGTRIGATACLAAMTWAVASAATAGPAGAGGADWITAARDRYEPGQTVVMIGYGQAADDQQSSSPYHAWLRVDPVEAEAPEAPILRPTDRRVAPVVVERLAAPDRWRTHRASITFDLPADLPPAPYQVVICNEPCTTAGLGTFWPETVHVGVEPTSPVVRDWPLDEPIIRWLEDDALIRAPWGETVTAADVRAGMVEPPPSTAPAAGSTDPATADPSPTADRKGGAPADRTSEPPVGEAVAQEGATVQGAADPPRDRWAAARLLLLVGGAAVACSLIGSRHMLRRARGGRRTAAAHDGGPPSDGTQDGPGRTDGAGAPPDPEAVLAPDREVEPASARPAHRGSTRVRL